MTAVRDSARLAAVRATGLLDTGPDEAFDHLARLAASLVEAPFAFVTVVDEARSFWKSCIGVASTDPADRQNTVEESFCQYVIETDEPLIVGDARSNEMTHDNPSIVSMNVIAWAGFPLRSADGHVLGTFCVVDTVPRQWSARDVEVLGSLASAVESEIRLRTLVDELSASAGALRDEMTIRENLASLARDLVAAESTDAVSTVIAERGNRVLGAAFASVALLDPERRTLRIRGPRSLDAAITSKYLSVPLADSTPLGDAVRTLEPVLLRDHPSHAPRYVHLLADATATGLESTAALPLIRSDGTAVGALGVGWAEASEFGPGQLALLTMVASMCAQAIERAQLGDRRNGLITSLGYHLLPEPQHVEGLETSVRYLAATFGIGFGGDWYDVIALADGRAAVVIGDIAGHGIEAAARMAQVRGAVNALTRLHVDDLPAVFDLAEEMLAQRDEVFIATLAVFVIDPRESSVVYVSAGHPPALIVDPDGSVVSLEDGRRPLLGQGGARPTNGRARLDPGSVLVAYTDGLIERRRATIDVGIGRLSALLSAAATADRLSPDALVDELLTTLISAEQASDDVAVIAVRNTVR